MERVDVLLAEDNKINQIVTRQILTKSGFSCDVVDNGNAVLTALSEKRYRLVLMDVQMPGIDGFEATRRIRNGNAGAENSSIPVIAMTAYTGDDERQRCAEAGMDDYISKPLDMDKFVAKIKQILENGDARFRS